MRELRFTRTSFTKTRRLCVFAYVQQRACIHDGLYAIVPKPNFFSPTPDTSPNGGVVMPRAL
ncbi:hypothetical protein K474DRAFT_1655286 [Panus rudis PR-1116 ss-1]|nr:hypothetical protein K474DRAFT_1655286 [Panus rudis PR-1116 ss-1]